MSPDGSQIALIRGDGHTIWVMKANGEDSHPILSAPTEDLLFGPMWFPDGKRLGYHHDHNGIGTSGESIESCDLKGQEIAVVASTPSGSDSMTGLYSDGPENFSIGYTGVQLFEAPVSASRSCQFSNEDFW